MRAEDLKDLGFLKYYRLVRKWASKQYEIQEASLELIIFLDTLGTFRRKDFEDGVYLYSWDKGRWTKLLKDGWIVLWRGKNDRDRKYSIYKISIKGKIMISRIYRILMGEEDLPTSRRNVFYKNKTYTDKVFNKAMDDMLKDKDR